MTARTSASTATAAVATLAVFGILVASIPAARAFSAKALGWSQSSCRKDATRRPAAVGDEQQDADPYLWLEDVESEESLNFAKAANEACLGALGDPKTSETNTYSRVLAALTSDERIPHVSKYGRNDEGEEIMFNFWKDGNNPKGLWRRTTLSSYRTDSPDWDTVLNVDELAKENGISWVWKGSTSLPRARDPMSNDGQRVTRALLKLSRGGADAIHLKEFDLLEERFVPAEEGGFVFPEAKTRASYRSRDVLSIGSDFGGPDSLTNSGYPRTVREWVRGTKVEDAPTVFEGERTDVSVGAYVSDQRFRNGPIYEVRYRSLTFYTSVYYARTVQYEHLLAPNDPLREGLEEPDEFVKVDIQDDASISFYSKWMFISLRSDWCPVPGGETYGTGSLLYVDAAKFLSEGKEKCEYHVLFKPSERTTFQTYSCTQNYLIMSVLDNVKSKLLFYKLGEDGSLNLVYEDAEAKIRACHASAIDPHENDDFWCTLSGYTQPSTLYLADASRVDASGSVDTTSGYDDIFIVDKLKSLPEMYNAEGLVVTQKEATSKDGTKIPYFIVSKEGMELDGSTPTLLYGYGGFEVSLGPKYIATSGIAWLEKGGVYVEANIRGGGEFGPQWHQAALKENRQKSYDDFIAVAEDLIANKICSPATLAARGGSNGGLLMGNMYVQRPDLFGAIHCAVPLLDMKRYHTLLAGASWQAEYGNPDTDDWEFLKKYSPYHNIDSNVKRYPPMLVTTSTRDDRVHPGHARKMVKKLWDMGEGKDWPVYYYENIEGGHGGAADSKQQAFMTALAYDFMFDRCSKGSSRA
jgi:prolyl oligopeptidase